MTPSLANLAAYSLQLAIIASAALLVTRLLRLRAPLASLRFWQAILIVAVIAPLVQHAAIVAFPQGEHTATATLTSTAAIDAIAAGTTPAIAWLPSIVVAGAALRLLWLAVGFLRLRSITRRAEPALTLMPLLHDLSASLHTTATIALSDDVQTPATVGVMRPLILVPRHLLDLPERVQRAVIAHELIHVRRRDWLHTLADELWCAALWFHPAAALVASRLSLARETVVDEATIHLTRDRRAYAEALLAFANPQPHLPGVIALIGRRQLSQRIALIAEEEVMTHRRVAVSLSIALLLAGTAASAAVTTFPITRSAEQPTVYHPGDGVSLPTVVREVKPGYTREAMQKKIQGSVWMEVVVGANGRVADVKVTRSLDAEYGLDNQAIKAARQWTFRPGRKDGKPVSVRVTLEMTFALK